MLWNTWADRRVTLSDEAIVRDPDTGIIRGAEPLTLGPENSRRAILMVHGFAGTPNNFNELPARLADTGWHVHAMLLPGHGTSPRAFEITTAEQLEAAVVTELDALRERYETVVLLGHSMGGALATLIAARCKVDGLILVSPYYAITYRWYYLLRPETWAAWLSSVVRWVYRSVRMQPVNLLEAQEKILSYHWIPVRAALMAMGLAARACREEVAADITAPVLLIRSKRDGVIDTNLAQQVFEKIPAQHKRSVCLRDSDHIVFWDYDREEVVAQVSDFLQDLSG